MPFRLAGGRANTSGAVARDREALFVGSLGRLRGRRRLRDASAADHVQRAAAGAHDQHASRRHRQRTAHGSVRRQRGVLVRRRQDDRRLAGVERRRHPGVDPDIGRRQHAVPVEGGRDARGALVTRGNKGRHHHHDDERAQCPWIVDRQSRRRQAGPDPLDGGQRPLALRLPQRQRDRILRGERIGQRGGGPVADAGAAIEPAQGLLAARPAKPNQREQRHQRRDHEQSGSHRAAEERQRQPQPGPRDHQEKSDDSQKPRQMRPDALPRYRICRSLQGLRQLQTRDGVALLGGLNRVRGGSAQSTLQAAGTTA